MMAVALLEMAVALLEMAVAKDKKLAVLDIHSAFD
jgi:hypothetical protein